MIDILVDAVAVELLIGSIKTEILKSKQVDLTDKVRDKIQKEGLYHITTKESAEKIIESGFLIPSKGIVNNHFSRSRYGDRFTDLVYMFAGKPSPEMFKKNLSHNMSSDGTIYAVKYEPDKFDMENFTERLEDGAITHEGRLDIANSNPKLVRMKYENDMLVEIPWDEPVKENIMGKLKSNSVVELIRTLPLAYKEIRKNVCFRDKEKKLKRSIEIRKDEKKMLEQYNSEENKMMFRINKNGVEYVVSTIGTKINDGKTLTGFRVEQADSDFAKNVFVDAFHISDIPKDKITGFLNMYMNEGSVRSEYAGKIVIKDGKVQRELDEEYAHHFYNKQIMVVKNDATYEEYIELENRKKESQLSSLFNLFKTMPVASRCEATNFIKQAKENGLKLIQEFIHDEKGTDILGV